MFALLVIVRLILSAVFVVAGLSKLADWTGSRKSLREFGLPEALAGPAGILLPLFELVLGIGLLVRNFAWYAAAGAAGLFVVFIAAIALNLARGRHPDCHCFGQLHSKPIGPDLIARNIVLALLAGFILYSGPVQPGIVAFLDRSTAANQLWFILAAAAVAFLGMQSWFTLQLVQQGGRVLVRLDDLEKRSQQPALAPAQPGAGPAQPPPPGLPAGAKAPAFSLTDLDGVAVSLDNLIARAKPGILLFVHPNCGSCLPLLKEAADWQQTAAAHFRLAVISQGSRSDNLGKIKGLQFERFLLQDKAEVSEAYQALPTPSAVLVNQDGTIGSPVLIGSEAIRSLVVGMINQSVAGLVSIALKEGEAAPNLMYPGLDGKMMPLSDLFGEPAVLLFWNTGCGYCQQMAPDLKAWEEKPKGERLRMILLSGGSIEDNRKMELSSPILLDGNFSAGRVFGAGGTPSALWLDGEGRVASKLAVGREQIVSLVASRAAGNGHG